jgi:DHA1 family bicyclomycin/chloramphenicol resistance-like MFS transporter
VPAGAALPTSIEALIAFRVVHNLSAGAGSIAERGIDCGLFEGLQAQRPLSHITMVFAVALRQANEPLTSRTLRADASWPRLCGLLAAHDIAALLHRVVDGLRDDSAFAYQATVRAILDLRPW